MKVTPHLNFDGECEEAFKFYAECLGGRIATLMRWGESPMADKTPEGWARKVMHATLELGEGTIAGADAPPGMFRKPQGFSVALEIGRPAEAERIFKALSIGAEAVRMPLQETFWARKFGMLVDRYGTPWMVNCGKPKP